MTPSPSSAAPDAPSRLARWGSALAFVLACAVVAWLWRSFLGPGMLPARGDPSLPFQGSDLTPQHVPWLWVAIHRLWDSFEVAFWNPFISGGAPQFEVPDAGVLSLATLLGGLLAFELAVKGAMILHVFLGGLGVFLLARSVRVSSIPAALGALAFMLGAYLLDHFRVGHLSFVNPLGWLPLAFYLFHRALESEERGWRWAAASGALLGLGILEGGTTPIVYGGLGLALAAPALLLEEERRLRRFGRGVALGLVAAVSAFCVSAVQLLPMLSYLELTHRAGGLTLEHALWKIDEVANPIPPVPFLLLGALGFGWLWREGRRGLALWLGAACALGFAAAHSEAVFSFLWKHVPGFRFQRIPQRALVLVAIAGPPLVAAGLQGAGRLLAAWGGVGRLLGVGLAGWLVWALIGLAPKPPPMASPTDELAANGTMRWLAQHAGDARVHIWESPDRHWGCDHVTVRSGLQVLTSYTPSEHRDYLPGDFDPPGSRTWMSESYRRPARFWGLLNVRYVTSTSERSVPGFQLAATLPGCPVQRCQPAKSAGRYVYENSEWMPRAWQVGSALALQGPGRKPFEAALEIVGDDAFDPRRVALLQIPSGEGIPEGAVVARGAEEARAALGTLAGDEFTAVPVTAGGNRISAVAPRDGWLVLAEKAALYPGWRAYADGQEIPLHRANGVLSAVRAKAGQRIELRYLPPRFGLGLALLGAWIAAVTLAVVAPRLRRKPAKEGTA